MEKANLKKLEEKLKRVAEEKNLDMSMPPKQYMNFNGQQVEIVHYDGETLDTSLWITIRDADGIESMFETKYAVSQRALNRLAKSGLGPLLKKYRFKNYRTDYEFQKGIKQKAMSFVANADGWFAVLGQSGAGKSHICTAIVSSLAKQGKIIEYMLWMEAINKIKYNRKDNEEILNHYGKVEVLYIDDFLKTKSDTEPTAAEVELAFQILDARYRERKITIISSEKTENEIEKYDRAVYRRIVEMTGTENLIAIKADKNKDMSLKYKNEGDEANV